MYFYGNFLYYIEKNIGILTNVVNFVCLHTLNDWKVMTK